MSEEEKEAIEKLKDNFILTKSEQDTISNYIDKLEKENKQYKDTVDKLEDQIVFLSQILES